MPQLEIKTSKNSSQLQQFFLIIMKSIVLKISLPSRDKFIISLSFNTSNEKVQHALDLHVGLKY